MKIPEGYKLERSVDQKKIQSKKYLHWTKAELLQMLADWPDETTVWIETWHPKLDDLRIRPLETVSGAACSDPYVVLS